MSTVNFLLTNPYNSTTIWLFDSRNDATKFAISKNRTDPRHPAFSLFEVHGQQADYIGTLWRDFGTDFDPVNCWQAYTREPSSTWY